MVDSSIASWYCFSANPSPKPFGKLRVNSLPSDRYQYAECQVSAWLPIIPYPGYLVQPKALENTKRPNAGVSNERRYLPFSSHSFAFLEFGFHNNTQEGFQATRREPPGILYVPVYPLPLHI